MHQRTAVWMSAPNVTHHHIVKRWSKWSTSPVSTFNVFGWSVYTCIYSHMHSLITQPHWANFDSCGGTYDGRRNPSCYWQLVSVCFMSWLPVATLGLILLSPCESKFKRWLLSFFVFCRQVCQCRKCHQELSGEGWVFGERKRVCVILSLIAEILPCNLLLSRS